MAPIDIQVSRPNFKIKGHVRLPHLVHHVTQEPFAPEPSNLVGIYKLSLIITSSLNIELSRSKVMVVSYTLCNW